MKSRLPVEQMNC